MAITTLKLLCLASVLGGFEPVQAHRVALGQVSLDTPNFPGWIPRDVPAGNNATIVVTLALKLKNVDMLHRHLELTSDPDSPRYAEAHLSLNEIVSLIGSSLEATDKVIQWLRDCGNPHDLVVSHGFIRVELAVTKAEHCFGVELKSYTHSQTQVHTVGTLNTTSVPVEIAPLIDFVAGLQLPRDALLSQITNIAATTANTNSLNDRKDDVKDDQEDDHNDDRNDRKDDTTNMPSSSSGVPLTPAIVRRLYSLPSEADIPNTNNSHGIAAFSNESFLPTDLAEFQRMNNLTSHPVDRVIGPATFAKGTGEGDLDVEWIMGVAPTITTTVWATAGQRWDPCDGKFDNEPFLKWLSNVSATTTIPNVFSISYQDFEDGLATSFMERVSTEFAALAARGTTVMTGSGDWGVGCSATGTFRSDFPSSSPYVVSVGATTFPATSPQPVPGGEVGIHFSSGGFSNVFSRPSYQTAAVTNFLTKRNTVSHTLFNTSGRAFPDVSAVGWDFQFVINGNVGLVGGTSASSPTFAGVLSLLNSERLAAGMKTLGWVNPLLYKLATHGAFRDITVGNNGCDGCAGAVVKTVSCCGFNATEGWDPMTGLGTPVFTKMVKSATPSYLKQEEST